jgi:beta-N-acetylhexosaminidase
LLPIANPAAACSWVLTESRYGTQGRRFSDELRARVPGMRTQQFDSMVSLSEMEQALEKAGKCDTHVVAAYVSVAAYRGNVVLGGNYPAFFEKLRATGSPIVLISLGNPYLLRSLPTVGAYLATFSPVIPSEIAAAKAILGVIGTTGHLPVSIPGIAKYGDGIQLPNN